MKRRCVLAASGRAPASPCSPRHRGRSPAGRVQRGSLDVVVLEAPDDGQLLSAVVPADGERFATDCHDSMVEDACCVAMAALTGSRRFCHLPF